MNTIKCPICGTPGIPDYHKKDVVCPHCGSDLSIFKTISDVADSSSVSAKSARKFKILAIALPLLVALLAGLVSFFTNNKLKTEIDAKNETIAQLKDSVGVLNAKTSNLAVNTQAVEQNYFEYVVVYKDSPWGIVNKLFGRRSDWEAVSKRIALQNDLWDEQAEKWKTIYPGQTLKIYKE